MIGQTFNVLIGNREVACTVAIRLMIERLCGPTVQCVFTVVQRLDNVLAEADRHRFDLAILILGNLLAPEIAGQKRIEQTIAAIGGLKARCSTPLVALSAYSDGPNFPARVRQAGADEFLFLPLDWEACRAALTRCLTRVAGQSSGSRFR